MVGGWVFLGGREELEVEELVEDDREMARASGGGSDDFVVVFPVDWNGIGSGKGMG